MQSKKYNMKSIASGQTLNPRPATLVPFLYFELFTFDLLQRVTLETEKWEGCSMGQPDIGYHYYRRVADDDPIQDASREISISFRQPPILKGGLPIAYYRITNTDPEPGQSEQIKVFDFVTRPELKGRAVIEGAIVEAGEEKLTSPGKYNLEARTHVDSNTRSAPSVFTVIVQPNDP